MLLGKLNTKLPTEIVPVPEYGEGAEIMVRAMTAGEVEEYNLFGIKMEADKSGKYAPKINSSELVVKKHYFLSRCMVNEQMQPIATVAELQQAHNPGPDGPLDRCWAAVLRLSGMDRNVEEEAEAVKKIRSVG